MGLGEDHREAIEVKGDGEFLFSGHLPVRIGIKFRYLESHSPAAAAPVS
jgi:hypothetical protein